ncbi:MAG: hypothetical protein EOO38_17130 [Cytophagaceae bacterium]|nr:MAG: hypothetical protein EOO38_17130 [Cytophagaceae bacterium]
MSIHKPYRLVIKNFSKILRFSCKTTDLSD